MSNKTVIAGGAAGMMEALVCHPLGTIPTLSRPRILLSQFSDTIKVRMQLSRRARAPGVS